ncbi:MAG: hypothetical protein DRN04_09770 [Thermoprotei archaeon]|nr:MAG: hypothetical protein DRN04_09770 [Thermoprotei archaeon]
MVLPAELRRKYGIKEGSEVVLIDNKGYLIMIPRRSITELYGSAKEYGDIIDEMIREIHEERKREVGG